MSARILLVEDNPQNTYLAKFLLEHAGHTVVHAVNGMEAVAEVQREKPTLILMDIQMPQMDGYEAATRIREIEGLEAVPIVAVTSYAMPGDRQRAMEIGFAGYIEKPISSETFTSEVSKYLPKP